MLLQPIPKKIKFPLSAKQREARELLRDDTTVELVYGGGARGGKTWLGSSWIGLECIAKPGSAWLIGREELKSLKRTTLRTFFKVLNQIGMIAGRDYKFNQQDGIITFLNGSIVFLAELKRIPSDPQFDRMGSYDLTGIWIDEAQEVCKDVKDALQARFSVLSGKLPNGKEWRARPKSLYTCNPSKNWIYSDFWKPLVKDGKKIEGSAFITALFTDNPYIDHESYRKNILRTKNKIKIERLLHGNFEYDDAPNRLIDHDAIVDMFTNDFVEGGEKYLSADIAMQGSDLFVLIVWDGWRAEKIIVRKKTSAKEIETLLKSTARQFKVPRSNIVFDYDGVGNYLESYLEDAQTFKNGGRPLNEENFQNLKTQCYFKLAQKINANEIFVECDSPELREKIEEELGQVRQKDADKDSPLRIIPKALLRGCARRVLQVSVALMLLAFFDLAPEDEGADFIEL